MFNNVRNYLEQKLWNIPGSLSEVKNNVANKLWNSPKNLTEVKYNVGDKLWNAPNLSQVNANMKSGLGTKLCNNSRRVSEFKANVADRAKNAKYDVGSALFNTSRRIDDFKGNVADKVTNAKFGLGSALFNTSRRVSELKDKTIYALKAAMFKTKTNLGRVAYIVSLVAAVALIGVGFAYSMPLLIAGSIVAGSTALAGGIYEIRRARAKVADSKEAFDAIREQGKVEAKEAFVKAASEYFEIARVYQNPAKSTDFESNKVRFQDAYKDLVKAYTNFAQFGTDVKEVTELFQSVNEDSTLRIDLNDGRFGILADFDPSNPTSANVVSWDKFSEILVSQMVQTIDAKYQALITSKAIELAKNYNLEDITKTNQDAEKIFDANFDAMTEISSKSLGKTFEQIQKDLLAKIVKELGGEDKISAQFKEINFNIAAGNNNDFQILEDFAKASFESQLVEKDQLVASLEKVRDLEIEDVINGNKSKIDELNAEIAAFKAEEDVFDKVKQSLLDQVVTKPEECKKETAEAEAQIAQIESKISAKEAEIASVKANQEAQIAEIKEVNAERIDGVKAEKASIEKIRDNTISSQEKLYLAKVEAFRTVLANLLNVEFKSIEGSVKPVLTQIEPKDFGKGITQISHELRLQAYEKAEAESAAESAKAEAANATLFIDANGTVFSAPDASPAPAAPAAGLLAKAVEGAKNAFLGIFGRA
ncbi:MAG: hypothetical protein KR126chlam6_00771 [Candidatus Anoxychlamydiales bacterium]|nr:hypothetical protein [Candidatus Anoxychlamydiales bacterium]